MAAAIPEVNAGTARTNRLVPPRIASLLLRGACLLAILLAGGSAHAETSWTYTWDGTFGNWKTAHWFGGPGGYGYPVSDDTAYIHSGMVQVSEAITYSGNTTISAGCVCVQTGGSLGNATITINGGVLKLTGGSLGNAAISLSGTGTLAVQPGNTTTISVGSTGAGTAGATLDLRSQTFDMNDGAISTFNLEQEVSFSGPALTIADGATLRFNLGSAGADLLAVTGGASVNGTVNVTIDASSLTPGSYDLITAASGLTTGSETWQFTGGGTTQTVTVGGNTYNLTLNAADTTVGVTVANTPTKLAITSVNGGANPTAGTGFSVVVEAQDSGGTAQNVSQDTLVTLSVTTGSETLGGTVSGTIIAGNNQVTISGATYTKAEGGVVVTVSRTSGDTLAPGDSAPFTVVAGPIAKFALVLASPQANSLAFTGVNTLTAQDAEGNTLTTFDASVDNVRIVAHAPLIGKVAGLGTGNNNVLNRATDFVAGVADLTAWGVKFYGNIATGTFTATSSTGATGTSGSVEVRRGTPDGVLDVFVWVTLRKCVHIAWGDGTTGKIAGDVTALDWTVQDSADGQVGRGTTCVSNEAPNNMAMNLENTSNTGTKARVSAAVTGDGGWNIGRDPATDTFVIQAQLTGNSLASLTPAAQELTDTIRLAEGANQALVLTVMTPMDVTRDTGVGKVLFVTLTATAE